MTIEGAQPRMLRAGVNFTNRGELKYARAVHLANELRGRIDEWAAAETLLASPHLVDEHTVEFRLILKRRPPIEEWSLILGDVLHNLRSVLDNVTWGLATLDGAVPARADRVSFPVSRHEAGWRDATRHLESVPPEMLGRLRLLQPWVSGLERDESLLGLLHSFDIIDKHRDVLASSLRLSQIALPNLSFNPQPSSTASEAQLVLEQRKTPVDLVDGAILTTVHCATHTLHPDLDFVATVGVSFALNVDDTKFLMLDGFLRDLFARMREWLDLIYGGELFAKARIHQRDAPAGSVSMGYHDAAGQLHLTHLPMVEDPEYFG